MTIYALSSGPGVAGISVIRVSGPKTSEVISQITKKNLQKPYRHLQNAYKNI